MAAAAAAVLAAARPRRVTAVGAGVDITTSDVDVKQVLIMMEGTPERYWHHWLIHRISEARWVTCEPGLTIQVDNLENEEIVPLARAASFPLPGRPFLTMPVLSEAQISSIFAQADTLAQIHGATIAVRGPALDERMMWVFADFSYELFGQEVPGHITSNANLCRFGGDAGIVQITAENGGTEWTTVSRVLRTGLEAWIASKRHGIGRDPRLSSQPVATSDYEKPLLRHVLSRCGAPGTPPGSIFTGNSSVCELLSAILKANQEIPTFLSTTLSAQGVSATSSAGYQLSSELWSLHFLIIEDRLDPYRSVVAEHLSRSILRLIRGLRRNGKAPDFSGLSGYLAHLGDTGGAVHTPMFDKHIADLQRDDAQYLKQMRLAREEAEHEATRKNKNKKNQGE